ncbi:class I SAM-dependent DNA methyltransferase [Alloacidobacterium dinghuense]|uniref:site-specific DNA-methyltransferase (adenine-specific) n=1 Tax=Alloacidobacterium dinghuense TaxID=2763107 RepID=A0A7G8BCN9_9BACT|nr:class I SAM-dependent DNA methyltransferase [Alloacidobacterium dinghuense]QNI30309.1 class I SAM-dependent DNA methyltransferase [Alloacidobacterium dinghuense]
MPLSVAEFVYRWKINSQSERSGAQSHFIDLCDMLGEKHPAASDSAGERYAFEKPVSRTRGGKGYADVWMRDHFAWEYKGKHKDLKKAYEQLNDYREDLGNPPLLVVCDLDRFEVHTNFTATSKRIYAFNLEDLNRNQVTATCPLPPIDVLRALFGDYSILRPERTDAQVTQDAARLFSRLAERLEIEDRSLGATRAEIAHFLMRLLFCLFADSIGLLPNRVFRNLLQSEDRFTPKRFLRKLRLLFEAMSERDGIFGEHTIKWFNGGLFDSASIIELDRADLGILYEISKNYDWSHVAPAIFGTLFERSLDPARRSLIGAHYTSEEDILLLIEPVLMHPLKQKWAEVRQRVLEALEVERAEEAARNSRQARLRADRQSEKILGAWIEELTSVSVLDPACGSGNFLYVALRRMLDLWLEATRFAAEQGISLVVPRMVSPSQLFGIETEFYAHELASIVVWIGFLQWKHEHGVLEDREPILEKLSNIEHGDAILRYDAESKPYEAEWPRADYIIGNPPYLGGNKVRQELGDQYVTDLFKVYKDRLSGFSDLVCYWFERARTELERGCTKRVGLLATQSIRGGVNRRVIQKIEETGAIFMAWSDREWRLDGAIVHFSFIAFDDGSETQRTLDGQLVVRINSNLTADADTTATVSLPENAKLWAYGSQSKGSFNITADIANKLLVSVSPFGRDYRKVVLRSFNGGQLLDGTTRWVIDFGENMSETEASLYEAPFEYVKCVVKTEREKRRERRQRTHWWLHARPSPKYRAILKTQRRYIATAATSKHRVFVWLTPDILVDHAIIVFAREDDYFLGVLQSSTHEIWSRAKGTQVREAESGFRYTPSSTFETFSFPWPPGTEPSEKKDTRVKAIADTARELVRLRDAWLNPSGVSEDELRKRTLTNLYNQRPEWLANAHRRLDEAVFAAYGWSADLTKQEILARLLILNHERSAKEQETPEEMSTQNPAIPSTAS